MPFSSKENFIGIVVNTSEEYDGVEIYWFNNHLFKVINCDQIALAGLGPHK